MAVRHVRIPTTIMDAKTRPGRFKGVPGKMGGWMR